MKSIWKRWKQVPRCLIDCLLARFTNSTKGRWLGCGLNPVGGRQPSKQSNAVSGGSHAVINMMTMRKEITMGRRLTILAMLTATCSGSITSTALIDNIGRFLLTIIDNVARCLLTIILQKTREGQTCTSGSLRTNGLRRNTRTSGGKFGASFLPPETRPSGTAVR
jgi:hypothetical protein